MQWLTRILSFLTQQRWRGGGWCCNDYDSFTNLKDEDSSMHGRKLFKEWFSWDLWPDSAKAALHWKLIQFLFPRESTATELGIRNEVILKMKYMVESWLPQELYLLKSWMGKKMWSCSLKVFCSHNLLKPVGGIFSRILGHIAFIFYKLQTTYK